MRRQLWSAPWRCTRGAHRLDAIDPILIETQEPAVRIIDKTGPLDNPADRDHCLQYMVAVAADLRSAHRRGLRG